jgi:hypothetical protein
MIGPREPHTNTLTLPLMHTRAASRITLPLPC